MRIIKSPNGHHFHLDEPGDKFSIAKQWVLDHCEPSSFHWHDDIAYCRGEWTWCCYTYNMNHHLEATDSGKFYTTNNDEATMFVLASGQWTGFVE